MIEGLLNSFKEFAGRLDPAALFGFINLRESYGIILYESINLFNQLSLYLLAGFLLAGLLHVLISPRPAAVLLKKNSISSIIRASLFGVPRSFAPQGISNASKSLRRAGVGTGAVAALTASGVNVRADSTFCAYAFFGPFFAIYRLISAIILGIFSGINVYKFASDEPHEAAPLEAEPYPRHEKIKYIDFHLIKERFLTSLRYGLVFLPGKVGFWILSGVIVGAMITHFVPKELIHTFLGTDQQALLVMLAISIPLHICATGAVPIAAVLMAKGVSPGALLVFLIVGPATNPRALFYLIRSCGSKALIVYLVFLSLGAVGLGYVLDLIWPGISGGFFAEYIMRSEVIPVRLQLVSSFILLAFILYGLELRFTRRRIVDEEVSVSQAKIGIPDAYKEIKESNAGPETIQSKKLGPEQRMALTRAPAVKKQHHARRHQEEVERKGRALKTKMAVASLRQQEAAKNQEEARLKREKIKLEREGIAKKRFEEKSQRQKAAWTHRHEMKQLKKTARAQGIPPKKRPIFKRRQPHTRDEALKESVFVIPGIVCQYCVEGLKDALHKIEGVLHVHVNHEKKTMRVKHKKSTPYEKMAKKIASSGFNSHHPAHEPFAEKGREIEEGPHDASKLLHPRPGSKPHSL